MRKKQQAHPRGAVQVLAQAADHLLEALAGVAALLQAADLQGMVARVDHPGVPEALAGVLRALAVARGHLAEALPALLGQEQEVPADRAQARQDRAVAAALRHLAQELEAGRVPAARVDHPDQAAGVAG